jgi:formylglycine-generating enzyme required for sulfatase activity
VKEDGKTESCLMLGVPGSRVNKEDKPLTNKQLLPQTFHALARPGGEMLYSAVWRKGQDAWNTAWGRTEADYAKLHGDKLPVDVSLTGPAGPVGRMRSEVLALLGGSLSSGVPRAVYAGLWVDTPGFECVRVSGLEPAAQQSRGRELAAAGYRPAALSVAEIEPGRRVSASLWYRPMIPEAARVTQASRRANAAAALLLLGRGEDAWPQLRHTPEPDTRSYLVERLDPLGVDARTLLLRLDAESDVSARRALILALGEFTGEQLPADVRAALVPRLLRWYRDDPDPGIHGAVDWLLRHSREGPVPRPLDWGQAEALRKIDSSLAGQPPSGGRRWYVTATGQTLTLIPGPVEFLMGSPGSEPGHYNNERLHRQHIGRSFAIATKPVTVAQFSEFRSSHPKLNYGNTGTAFSPKWDGPVNNVSWYDAAQYCRWLSEKEGVPEDQMCYPPMGEIEKCKNGATPIKPPAGYLARTGYRLPTEAEWEYACRAGAVSSRYYGRSEALLGRYSWYVKNSNDRAWSVGQKRPNDLGLFDMHGNTLQWCQQTYGDYPVVKGMSPAEDDEDNNYILGERRLAVRGGSFNHRSSHVRAAFRGYDFPTHRHTNLGLRVARTYR